MSALVDTNILVRFFDSSHADHQPCVDAIRCGQAQPGRLNVCLQIHIEFWSVATRPLNVNGLGLTPNEAGAALGDFDKFLPLLPDPPDIADRWRKLVMRYGVSGRSAHDARIAAWMESTGTTELLTLNGSDFYRFSHVRVITPADILRQ